MRFNQKLWVWISEQKYSWEHYLSSSLWSDFFQNPSPLRVPSLDNAGNPTFSSPSNSDASGEILDMVHAEGQETNTCNGGRSIGHPIQYSSNQAFVKDQISIENHVNWSLNMENVIFSRLSCDTGFSDGALENPSICHRRDHYEPASGKAAVSEAFSIWSHPTNQELPLVMYNLKNYPPFLHKSTRMEVEL